MSLHEEGREGSSATGALLRGGVVVRVRLCHEPEVGVCGRSGVMPLPMSMAARVTVYTGWAGPPLSSEGPGNWTAGNCGKEGKGGCCDLCKGSGTHLQQESKQVERALTNKICLGKTRLKCVIMQRVMRNGLNPQTRDTVAAVPRLAARLPSATRSHQSRGGKNPRRRGTIGGFGRRRSPP